MRGVFNKTGSAESATIAYDGENDTWMLQDAAWKRTIDLGIDYSTGPARPEEIRYTRNIAIEGGAIGLDFFVRNFAGEDCAHADFAMTTEVEHLNATTGSMEGDTIITSVPSVVPVDDLANGQWREVRVQADLPRPKPEAILLFSITLTAPCTFTTQNGTILTYNPNLVTVIEHGYISRVEEIARDPGYVVKHPPQRDSATFIVQGTDAPGIGPLPMMTAG